MVGVNPTEAKQLTKANLSHRFFHGRREIIERERTLVFVQSEITHDVVGIGSQPVGEISNGFVLTECDKKIDVLE